MKTSKKPTKAQRNYHLRRKLEAATRAIISGESYASISRRLGISVRRVSNLALEIQDSNLTNDQE